MSPHPTDGRFAIFDLGWEYGVLAEAVIDGHDGVALLQHGERYAVSFAPHPKGPAMNPDNHRHGGGRSGDIEVEGVAGMTIADILQVMVDGRLGGEGVTGMHGYLLFGKKIKAAGESVA
jgi:hypothetical protein